MQPPSDQTGADLEVTVRTHSSVRFVLLAILTTWMAWLTIVWDNATRLVRAIILVLDEDD